MSKNTQNQSVQTIAQQLFDKAFNSPRNPRSNAYKDGVLKTLEFKDTSIPLKNPHQIGTAECDAWYAGNREGHAIWSDYLMQEVS